MLAGFAVALVLFVVTVGAVDRAFGAGYGRTAKLPPRVVEVLSVIAGFLVLSLILLAWAGLGWF